jgi:hypothetical protein
MAARITWLLNLDADLELQDPATYRDLALPPERLRELQSRMFDLVAADDVMIGSQLVASADVVQAFCPTPTALARIAALGLVPPCAPPFAVLRRVNDRRFCAELGQTLPRANFIEDMQALEQHIEQPSPSGSYVIKRAFSFAGREQRRVHGSVLDASTRGFCERSFKRNEGVQIEPWVERLADYSKHGHVGRDGKLLIGTTRGQQIDPMGRFQQMLPDAITITEPEDATLTANATLVGAALHNAGYFGPFGIDAFRYKLPNETIAFNPRCEINARYTMGYPRELLLRALTS